MPATIEIAVEDRWDAVALMRRLTSYHSYLIQRAPAHWVVRAGCPGRHGEQLPTALAAIEASLASRRVARAAVQVDGRIALRPDHAEERP